MTSSFRKLSNKSCLLGEGLFWRDSNNSLYWVDITKCTMYWKSWNTGKINSLVFPLRLGWVIEALDGKLLIGFEDGIAILNELTYEWAYCWRLEMPRKSIRLNDAFLDAQGSIWFGTMDDLENKPLGKLWKLNAERTICQQIDDGYIVSNGPIVSQDCRTVLSTATNERCIYRLYVDSKGSLLRKEKYIEFDESMGYPDGMDLDSFGNLWVASWGAGKVFCFDTFGKLINSVDVPAPLVTNVIFIGKQQTMCVTTACCKLSKADLCKWPLSGHLLQISVY